MCAWLSFLASSSVIAVLTSFNFSGSDSCVLLSNCSFNLCFLLAKGAEHLFVCLSVACVSSSVQFLFLSFVEILIELSIILLLMLYTLLSLCKVDDLQTFSSIL